MPNLDKNQSEETCTIASITVPFAALSLFIRSDNQIAFWNDGVERVGSGDGSSARMGLSVETGESALMDEPMDYYGRDMPECRSPTASHYYHTLTSIAEEEDDAYPMQARSP